MKKLLSIFFALAVMLAALPLQIFAEEAEYISFCGNDDVPANITEIAIGTGDPYGTTTDKMKSVGIDPEKAYFNRKREPVDIKELWQKLPKLEKISIVRSDVKNAAYFAKFRKLTTLELYDCKGISNLQFAPNCKGLTEFAYTCEGLSDISEIGKMKHLKKLTIADATTYEYVGSDFIELQKKVIDGNYLRYLTPLENLTNLTELTVEGAAVEDITPILNMPKLTKFTLSNAVKTDLSPLEKLDDLKSFTFSVSGKRFIKESGRYGCITIPALKKLSSLSLSGGSFYDDSLFEQTGLKTLELKECIIENRDEKYQYSGKKLPKLETLRIYGSDIADKTISQFDSVKKLTVSKCLIRNVTMSKAYDESEYSSYNYSLNYLKNFKYLEKLTVWNCKISDISSLENLVKLKYLNLSDNYIKDITPLEKLANLKTLNLSDANWYDKYENDFLEPLRSLTSLENLDISWIYDSFEDEDASGNIDMWKSGTENSVFDIVSSLPNLKSLTVSALTKYGYTIEEENNARKKLFEEKMPYCEINTVYPSVSCQ